MKKLLSVLVLLFIALPSFAVNCYKKPCHKKCIEFQDENIKLQCYCNGRKNVYYRWGHIGVPAYDSRCETQEEYLIKYCEAKRHYDNAQMINNINYLSNYDANCDGQYEDFLIRQRKEQEIRLLSQPQTIYVNHNIYGTVDVNTNYTRPTTTYPLAPLQYQPVRVPYTSPYINY